MNFISLTTIIEAPIEICFDISRSIDVHMASVAHTRERAVGGTTSGLINEGEHVEWEAVHFGITQRLSVIIEKMNRPYFFSDRMVKGAFKSMYHEHFFEQQGADTIMIDKFQYEVPYGIAGRLFNKVVLYKYMKGLLLRRNTVIKEIAEGGNKWKQYLFPDKTEDSSL